MLKNPSHLFALDALMAAYPDALVIQTHRAPRTIMALDVQPGREGGRRLVGRSSRGEVIGRAQLDLWARGADEFRAARARHDPARFCDVRYEDFVADPIGTGRGCVRPLRTDAHRRGAGGDDAAARGEPLGRGPAGAPLQPGGLRPDRGGRRALRRQVNHGEPRSGLVVAE